MHNLGLPEGEVATLLVKESRLLPPVLLVVDPLEDSAGPSPCSSLS